MHLRHALVVTLQKALQDLRQEYPLIHADPAHDAEIDQHQSPVRREDHVPLMQVGMEEAMIQRTGKEPARDPARRRRQLGGDLLDQPVLAHVATIGPTGEPQNNPVCQPKKFGL